MERSRPTYSGQQRPLPQLGSRQELLSSIDELRRAFANHANKMDFYMQRRGSTNRPQASGDQLARIAATGQRLYRQVNTYLEFIEELTQPAAARERAAQPPVVARSTRPPVRTPVHRAERAVSAWEKLHALHRSLARVESRIGNDATPPSLPAAREDRRLGLDEAPEKEALEMPSRVPGVPAERRFLSTINWNQFGQGPELPQTRRPQVSAESERASEGDRAQARGTQRPRQEEERGSASPDDLKGKSPARKRPRR